MEKRIDITEQQHKAIWKGRKVGEGDYFVMTTVATGRNPKHCEMILFNTIEEAKAFNDSVSKTFKTWVNV